MRYLVMMMITLIPAERPFQPQIKTDRDFLQGTWILIEVQRETPILADKMLGNRVVIAGDEYKRFTNEEPPIIERTFRLYPDTQPKSIDLVAKNPGGQDYVYKGIYEIKGDTFRFSFALYGQERPKEFRVAPGLTANTVTTYQLVHRPR
jgi:uncharacterized protein (TIGR03067 family)